MAVSHNGKHLGYLNPEKRWYPASEQGTSEVALISNLKEDLYVVFAGVSDDEQRAVIQLYLNPLVVWVWIGTIVMALGTIVAILPDSHDARIQRRKRELERILAAQEKL
jgi:cytochrome c-type biogenesis protein CcmF